MKNKLLALKNYNFKLFNKLQYKKKYIDKLKNIIIIFIPVNSIGYRIIKKIYLSLIKINEN